MILELNICGFVGEDIPAILILDERLAIVFGDVKKRLGAGS